ncbi:hypothetical protein, partial [Granulicella sp. L46]|uniref:hypothetical protein n=1 Tax=Granulicella sp. L46 TaxID=1641865 RepID=UPI001C2081D8
SPWKQHARFALARQSANFVKTNKTLQNQPVYVYVRSAFTSSDMEQPHESARDPLSLDVAESKAVHSCKHKPSRTLGPQIPFGGDVSA